MNMNVTKRLLISIALISSLFLQVGVWAEPKVALYAKAFQKIPPLAIIFENKTYQPKEYRKYFEDGSGTVLYLTLGLNQNEEEVLYASLSPSSKQFVSVTDLNFDSVSQEVAQLESFFIGDNRSIVFFNAEKARKSNFSEESILLALELADFTNELVNAVDKALSFSQTRSSQETIKTLEVKTENYSFVEWYFAEAKRQDASPISTRGWCRWELSDAACSCGHWLYPRPNSAKNWITHTGISNPTQKLRT